MIATGKTIVLVVSILMPQAVPDIQHVTKMDNFDACWDGAREFMTYDLTDEMRSKGALGLSATCAFQDAPSQRN